MKVLKAAEEGKQTGKEQKYTRLCHMNNFCVYAESLALGCEGLWSEGSIFSI